MAIAAILAGQGVALVPHMYMENKLRSGMLVSPWPISASLSKNFCLVKPTETGINEAAVEEFDRWLLAEMNTPASLQI